MMRKILFLVGISVLAACSNQQTPTQLCNQTVKDYAALRDNPETAETYAGLFTDDGIFVLGPNPVSGRDALMARHQASHENSNWLHDMNKISITDADGAVSGVSRVTVKTSAKNDPKTERTIVADYIDIFEMADGKCLIKSRTVKVLTDDTVTID